MKEEKLQAMRARKWAQDTLPLLKVLKSFKKGAQRTTLLRYLNDEACESIYHMIANILQNEKASGKAKTTAATALKPYRGRLLKMIQGKCQSPKDQVKLDKFKRETLCKMGGGALSTVLSIGVPLLVSLLGAASTNKKKKKKKKN